MKGYPPTDPAADTFTLLLFLIKVTHDAIPSKAIAILAAIVTPAMSPTFLLLLADELAAKDGPGIVAIELGIVAVELTDDAPATGIVEELEAVDDGDATGMQEKSLPGGETSGKGSVAALAPVASWTTMTILSVMLGTKNSPSWLAWIPG